jgi:hypothetical protein
LMVTCACVGTVSAMAKNAVISNFMFQVLMVR